MLYQTFIPSVTFSSEQHISSKAFHFQKTEVPFSNLAFKVQPNLLQYLFLATSDSLHSQVPSKLCALLVLPIEHIHLVVQGSAGGQNRKKSKKPNRSVLRICDTCWVALTKSPKSLQAPTHHRGWKCQKLLAIYSAGLGSANSLCKRPDSKRFSFSGHSVSVHWSKAALINT